MGTCAPLNPRGSAEPGLCCRGSERQRLAAGGWAGNSARQMSVPRSRLHYTTYRSDVHLDSLLPPLRAEPVMPGFREAALGSWRLGWQQRPADVRSGIEATLH